MSVSPSTFLPIEGDRRAKVFAALADPTRLQIVDLLIQTAELSSSEIAQQLDISLALLCHHGKILVEAGILTARKEGQTKYNALNRETLQACFGSFPGLFSE